VGSPNGGQGAETTGSLDVTNETNNVHGRGFEDGDDFDDFLLIELGALLVHFTENVSVTSLVAHKGGEVRNLVGIIDGESSDLSWKSKTK
jgi:hypothetical protein